MNDKNTLVSRNARSNEFIDFTKFRRTEFVDLTILANFSPRCRIVESGDLSRAITMKINSKIRSTNILTDLMVLARIMKIIF